MTRAGATGVRAVRWGCSTQPIGSPAHVLQALIAEINLCLPDVVDLLCDNGGGRGLKLFHTDTTSSGMTEVTPRLAEAEADVQVLVEAHMETLLGVRFLASEYGTGPVHAGRIDSLGLDENGSPVIVEFTDLAAVRT